jgi:hypothetical protein
MEWPVMIRQWGDLMCGQSARALQAPRRLSQSPTAWPTIIIQRARQRPKVSDELIE